MEVLESLDSMEAPSDQGGGHGGQGGCNSVMGRAMSFPSTSGSDSEAAGPGGRPGMGGMDVEEDIYDDDDDFVDL